MSNTLKGLTGVPPEKQAYFSKLVEKKGGQFNSFPLSFAQERLWFLNQLEPESPFYNVNVALRLAGKLDRDALSRSLEEIVRRHESLRTVFLSVNGLPVQVVLSRGKSAL